MNLKTHIEKQNCAGTRNAVALVITLLMLSVITFLAIAFLAMTSRDRNAVTATLDVNTARSMSEAALARSQAEIIAQMMSTNDILSYDYRTSHNYVSPFGFFPNNGDFTNVSFDYLNNGTVFNSSSGQNWAQNINNLLYDPRPPVFVATTNSTPSDFRYWVDLNRNGKFESNGYINNLDINGNFIPGSTNYYNGEPEWIGVLKYPETNHSSTNPFVGRYAYMVLPIGKTLDWNFIHNYSKNPGGRNFAGLYPDAFGRDEGVGSWELNLAAVLYDTSSSIYQAPTALPYFYSAGGSFNSGLCFNDAAYILGYRYASNNFAGNNYPLPLKLAVSLPLSSQFVDEYAFFQAIVGPFDYNQNIHSTPPTSAWPGSYNTNMIYDVQDLFDPSKTGPNFARTWLGTNAMLDTYDRYTFQRLLACIGTSSAPEYGVYVHDNSGNLVLKTKVNINYNNTAQIQTGPYAPMSTNLTLWTNALGFFTNAADLLLRSQTFIYTNFATNAAGQFIVSTNYFGLTNIPVCMTNGKGTVSYLYNEQVHRMLQLAANIYDAANCTNYAVPGANPIYQPHAYRPQLTWSNAGASTGVLYITGFVPAPNQTTVLSQIKTVGFKEMTNSTITTNDYVWGVPWVVGAVKGIPAFNQYAYNSRIFYNRELLFIRQTNSAGPITNKPPQYTNQFYVMCISNSFGTDAWNPYTNIYTGVNGNITVYVTNFITVSITNNYNYGTVPTNFSTYYLNSPGFSFWPGLSSGTKGNQSKVFLQTNFVSLPLGYYSETQKQFEPFSPTNSPFTDGFLPQDQSQTHWPVHNWTLNITNHVAYILMDGPTVVDFVNLGPFGSSISISNLARGSADQGGSVASNPNGSNPYEFNESGANDTASSPMSVGIMNQITDAINSSGGTAGNFYHALNGTFPTINGAYFTTSAQAQNSVLTPYYITDDIQGYMPCDPLVHYTIGDLSYPNYTGNIHASQQSTYMAVPVTNSAGTITPRYKNGITNMEVVFGDPGMTNADAWQFPTNAFPSVGWLGRVHRGTPWQTVYLKSDDPTQFQPWYTQWVNSPYTYPTNDWSLIDLFTAVPNDNAARGLLSVNQTNDAAWAAVFAGVVEITNNVSGAAINPTNDVFNIVDSPNIGINAIRALNTNQLFHHIGDILQVPALTRQSPFVTTFTNLGGVPTEEMLERIPQQTLGLLKLGLPQFVIYSWGQSLKPKNLYQGGPANLNNICTNYEITGEFLTRTVCHIVGDPTASAPKIVVDSYNIEPGN